MKWTITLEIKNVDDDLDSNEVCSMIAAGIDIAYSHQHPPFSVGSIEAERKENIRDDEDYSIDGDNTTDWE